MSDPTPIALPTEALAALHRGDKIEAIKLVREAMSVDLKTAKDIVDRYIVNNPALNDKFTRAAGESGALWKIIFALVALATIIYVVLL